jgi:hypothetical protein
MQEVLDGKIIFKATHRGYVDILDKSIPCANLENGKRIISQTGLFESFDRPRKGEQRIENLPSIIGAKNLLPFVEDELVEKAKVIHYYHTNGKVAKGFDAEIIPLICLLYLDAEKENVLHASQKKSYERAFAMNRSLSKLGIIALIDEATGFQNEREAKALQTLLNGYLNPAFVKWQKRFPNQFYKEMFRIHNWEYDPTSTKRSPYVGRFTNKYVYDLFPHVVMEKIKDANAVVKKEDKSYRKRRHFQYLTTDIGLPHLDNHVSKLLGVMKLSKTEKNFKENFFIAFEEELLNKENEVPGFIEQYRS